MVLLYIVGLVVTVDALNVTSYDHESDRQTGEKL